MGELPDAQTVLLVVHDENGGFFDHVPPVTAPPGTAGEWLTATALPAAAEGITGPVGLGFRTPLPTANSMPGTGDHPEAPAVPPASLTP